MAVVARIHCKDCGQWRLFTKERISHVLHLLLALVSGGLWIPVWIICGIVNWMRPYHCPICGKEEY